MNKAFDEILSRLEDLKLPFPDACYCGTTNDLIDETKKVVLKVAQEYKKENYFNLDHVALHKCPKCGGNAQHRLNNRGSWACGCFDCRLLKINYDHQKAIQGWEDYCKEYNNGWIPCSERLPTAEEFQRGNGRFLVTDGNRTYEAEFDIYESHTFCKSQMASNWFVTDNCVTHWQNEPLPKPYHSEVNLSLHKSL